MRSPSNTEHCPKKCRCIVLAADESCNNVIFINSYCRVPGFLSCSRSKICPSGVRSIYRTFLYVTARQIRTDIIIKKLSTGKSIIRRFRVADFPPKKFAFKYVLKKLFIKISQYTVFLQVQVHFRGVLCIAARTRITELFKISQKVTTTRITALN